MNESAALSRRDIILALNDVILRLERTMPEDGTDVAAAIYLLELLCGRLIRDSTDATLDPIKRQVEAAVATATELLSRLDSEKPGQDQPQREA